MNAFIKRTGLVSAVVALAAVSACSEKAAEIDPSLKADLAAVGGGSGSGSGTGDLELAPSSSKSTMVVSAIEGGPKATPKPAARVQTPRPAPKKVAQAPVKRAPVVRQPTAVAEAEPAPAPAPEPEQPAIQSTRQAPAQAPRQDNRVYKTEAEIFRQMPWIRP
jgi:hypothetical protein